MPKVYTVVYTRRHDWQRH